MRTKARISAQALAGSVGTNGRETMKPAIQKKDKSPQGKATYKITVQGAVPGSYSERLAGMRITTTSRWDQEAETVLEGPIQDQAELIGLLNNLYELHLKLLSVQRHPAKPKE
jgi:hypothetical protein